MNRTWYEGQLCHVVPCRAFSTLRGSSARCAECDSSQRLAQFNVVRRLVVLQVVPFNVFSTLRVASARCAGVIPVSVAPPHAVARAVSTWPTHAPLRQSINALAQHALAADAASRRARSRLFQCWYLLQCHCHHSVAAPLKRNPLGRHYSPVPYHLYRGRKQCHFTNLSSQYGNLMIQSGLSHSHTSNLRMRRGYQMRLLDVLAASKRAIPISTLSIPISRTNPARSGNSIKTSTCNTPLRAGSYWMSLLKIESAVLNL